MKKILWLMILIPIFITRVWASEVYYSEYGDFSNYEEKKIEKTDIVNVEETIMYKWYKQIKIPGGYKLYNSNDNFLDNCYETEYSNWSKTKPIMNEATILDERTLYNYQMVKPVRYIHLYNLDGSYSAFRITELQVFNDNNEINYTYTCKGCWQNFDKYIHNGIYAENMSIIDDGGSLIIDLGREYPINKINLIIYLFDIGNEDKIYTIGYSNDAKNIFVSKSFTQKFSLYYAKDSIKFEYNIANLGVLDNLWIYPQTSEQNFYNDYVYSKTSFQEYRYKEKMCQTYTLGKEYYPQYSENSISGYDFKDSPKTFYRYQTRDKLELNIHDITEKNYDLNNFVLYSSDNYSIKNDIDWDKNGSYKVNFTLNNLQVEKDVKVNILSNALEEKEAEINKLEEQLKNTINDYEMIIASLEKDNREYLNSLNELDTQIIELNKKIENLKNENINQNEFIEQIQNELDLKIKDHQEKIDDLERINNEYSKNLNILSNHIYDLEEKINDNQQNFNLQLEKLKEQIEKYIQEYDKQIKYLQDFNDDCIKKLEEINLNIKNINDFLVGLKITTDDMYDELSKKIEENTIAINSIKSVINNNYDEFKELNSEVEKIKKQIQEIEINNKNTYNDLTNELENTKQDMTKNLDSLKDQIESIEIEISNLNNNSEIKEKQIKSLQNKLEESIQIYEKEVKNLNNLNSLFSNKLNDLSTNIQYLEGQLNNISNKEDENIVDIQNLKIEIEDYNEKYNNIISRLEEFNQGYLVSLKNINEKFENIFIKIANMEIIDEEKNKELNDKINKNHIILEQFAISNNKKYEEVLNNQNNINDKVNDYQEVIVNLKDLNEKYILEISGLKDEIKKLGIEIEKIKNNNEYQNIDKYQKLIYQKLVENSNEILNIKQNLTIDNGVFESLKENILYVSSKLEEKEEVKDNNLNSKLNDYILKINGVEVVNLLWFYIILTILFGIYLIYLFRKKSNKKLF